MISYNTGEKGDRKWSKNKVKGTCTDFTRGERQGSSRMESFPLKEKRDFNKVLYKKICIFITLHKVSVSSTSSNLGPHIPATSWPLNPTLPQDVFRSVVAERCCSMSSAEHL